MSIKHEYTKAYDTGLLNSGVKAWFYLQRGLSVVNEFKYLVAGVLAIYYTFKLDSFWLLLAILLISLPVLTVAGWFHTHKMAKALEWNNMVFSSYFSRYNIDLAEENTEATKRTVKILEGILSELKKK